MYRQTSELQCLNVVINNDFNNCQTRGKAEDRAGVQTLTEVYSLHKISALWAF